MRFSDIGSRQQATGESDDIGDGLFCFELINGRAMNFAGNAYGRADRWHKNNIALSQVDIVVVHSFKQHIVYIHAGNHLIMATHLNIAQRTGALDAAGGDERIEQ